MGRWMGLAMLVAMLGAPLAAAAPLSTAGTDKCSKKRTDACGCHHVYGLKHCHPNKKTPHCEAPVKSSTKLPTPVQTLDI